MTAPGPAARHDGAGDRSPFTGSDVCAAAALPLVPGGRTVMFDQDVWDFGDVAGLAAYLHSRDSRLDFTAITDRRWRLVAKEYIYARLAPADPVVAVLPGACRVPLTLQSCADPAGRDGRLAELADRPADRLTGAGHPGPLRPLPDRTRPPQERRPGAVIGTLDDASLRMPAAVVIDLADYGELFTADRYAGGFTPWRGRTSSQVAGVRSGGENKTPPLDQQLLQPLLAAAFYMTENAGAPRRGPAPDDPPGSHLAKRRTPLPPRPPSMSCTAVLGRHLDAGDPCRRLGNAGIQARLARGWAPGDPLLPVSFAALANAAGARRLRPRHHATRPARPSSTRSARSASPSRGHATPPASPPPTARPRSRGPSRWTCMEARRPGAASCTPPAWCITAMITGMRSCELKELRTGCRRSTVTGPGLTRYRLAGKLIKGQGLGGTDDEWVVVEEVDRAVALAEQLCDDTTPGAAVFGAFAFSVRYPRLRDLGQRAGRAAPGPRADPRRPGETADDAPDPGPGDRLPARRPARREESHLKHVSAATTEGYTSRPGGAQAKLLAEIGEHEAERNLNLVAEEYRNYQNGIMPAGPGRTGADRVLRQRRRHRWPPPAPNVAASDQHLLNLLSKRAKVLHIGAANFCWFSDPQPGAVPHPCRHARRGRAADRHVRLRALPAGHPPPAAPRRLGRHRGRRHRVHRHARPDPQDRTGPPAGRRRPVPSASWTPSTPPRQTGNDPTGSE